VPFQLFYLLSFITLPIWTLSFGSLIFQFIERVFPDPLQYGGDFLFFGMRNSIAALLVAFPLYLFLMWRLWKSSASHPEQLQSLVRKWFTYIVLVVVAGVILGDLIALLNSFLGGELALRFSLKALSILAISASIFGYYLFELKRSGASPLPRGLKIFVGAVILLVFLSLVFAFSIMGSPGKQRTLQFDQRRVSDIQQISHAINSYWEREGKLALSFEELKTQPYVYIQSVKDPRTQEFYEYRVLGDKTYELCAVFETDSSEYRQRAKVPTPFSEEVWNHGIGRTCFEREVVSTYPVKALEPVRALPL
jgi:hypothetical protein